MKPSDLLTHYGSQAAISRACGIRQPSVCIWFKSGQIPPIRQLEIEALTEGALRADAEISRGYIGNKNAGGNP